MITREMTQNIALHVVTMEVTKTCMDTCGYQGGDTDNV
jgi:hypothetical protein